ncbi:MAG: hypothetical protein JWO60_1329 [Frankiales bacterium]|nr:hypothetical protein [Frankiales bacterium]
MFPRPVARLRPAALLVSAALALTAGGAVALVDVPHVASTSGLFSTKAITVDQLAAKRKAVQADLAAGSGPGYYASDNITFVKNVREAADGVGGRVVGDRLFVTSTKDLLVFDISTPTDPKKLGSVNIHAEFENEQVPTDGKLLGISGQTSTVTPQGGVCQADSEASRGCLVLYDVSKPEAPRLVQQIKGAGDHTSTCLTYEGQTCAFMYGSSGSISDTRKALSDPTPITESATNWLTVLGPQLRSKGWTGALPTRTHHQTEVRPGVVLTASVPMMYFSINAADGGSPEKPKLLSIASHLAAPDGKTRFVHSVEFPNAGKGRIMLSGGETNAQPRCGAENGAFSTFTTGNSGTNAAPTFTYADTYKLVEGTYTDGNTPAGGFKLGCSVHWFEQHPTFDNGGLVALAAYESGTKLLDISKDGTISERGFYLPVDSSASAPHWAPDGTTLYVVDYLRGLDVLTVDLTKAPGGPATLRH